MRQHPAHRAFRLGRLTDRYLLGLAVAHGGRLATFDAGIPRSAAVGAEARHPVVV